MLAAVAFLGNLMNDSKLTFSAKVLHPSKSYRGCFIIMHSLLGGKEKSVYANKRAKLYN